EGFATATTAPTPGRASAKSAGTSATPALDWRRAGRYFSFPKKVASWDVASSSAATPLTETSSRPAITRPPTSWASWEAVMRLSYDRLGRSSSAKVAGFRRKTGILRRGSDTAENYKPARPMVGRRGLEESGKLLLRRCR